MLYSSSFYSRVTFQADPEEKEEAHKAIAATCSASSLS